jgi:hypothetical protein
MTMSNAGVRSESCGALEISATHCRNWAESFTVRSARSKCLGIYTQNISFEVNAIYNEYPAEVWFVGWF